MNKTLHLLLALSIVSLMAGFALLASCTGQTADGNGSTVGEFPLFSPDESDFLGLNVIQTIPPNGSTGIDPSTSISIFFDDEINPSTINDLSIKVNVTSGGSIYGTYSGEFDTEGNTILKFVPFSPLPENSTIEVTLEAEDGIEDDGGNTLFSIYAFSFITQAKAGPLDSSDFDFEGSTDGFVFSGDGAIIGTAGDIDPYGGSSMAAISTGDKVVSGNNALGTLFGGSTTSILTTGTISVPGGVSTLSFHYNFVSAEFDEFIGSSFDDTFLVTVTGASSSTSQVVTSVNMYDSAQTAAVTLPSNYETADFELGDASETGWTKKSIDISTLGGQITASFVISDVGDGIYTTILFLDNIALE
jgi:hypothetical protein